MNGARITRSASTVLSEPSGSQYDTPVARSPSEFTRWTIAPVTSSKLPVASASGSFVTRIDDFAPM